VHEVAGSTGLVTFVLLTLWCHGPLSPLLPAAYEPVLVVYGQLFAPVLLALIGGVAATAVEYVNYRLYRRLLHCRSVDELLSRAPTRRIAALFFRQPFITVWICVLSPLPDWGARVLIAHSSYPVYRYLLAVLLARIPRFWFLAAIGLHLSLGRGTVLAILVGSVGVAFISLVRRHAMSETLPTAVPPATSLPETAMRAISLSLVVLGAALSAAPTPLQAQQPTRNTFARSAMGVSVDRFVSEGGGPTAVTFRLSALRPSAVGTEVGISLFPNALAGGALIIAPDLGAAYHLKIASATLLLKAGGSAITGLAGGFGFYPGVHVGAGLILPVENRAAFRIDVIQHFYQVEQETVRIWSIGVGMTALPRIPMR
jgi:membrane protein YqaA with SNARE-associated domain